MKFPTALPAPACLLGTIRSAHRPIPLTEPDIRDALDHPIWPDGSRRTVFDGVQPGESLCLVVSDHTRRSAAHLVLPLLLRGLQERGCSPNDAFVLVASGIHRPPTPEELLSILGPEAAERLAGRIFLHNADDASALVSVGKTTRGHDVRINRLAMEADRRILIGTATYHYHAGFGGGRKSLVPGLAGRETIAFNHSLTLDPSQDRIHPGVGMGLLDGNPVAEEMLEAARLCRPDFIVNTVLAPTGELVGVFAGELDAAHRAACRLVEETCRVNLSRLADFVVASAGSASNWIQSHKAFYNAHRAVRPGGWVALLAPCPEGLGNERFRYWIRKENLADMFRELRQTPEVLGQTALSTRTRRDRTILVTTLPPNDRADLGIRTAPDLDSAIRSVIGILRNEGIAQPTAYLIPEALHTVPFSA